MMENRRIHQGTIALAIVVGLLLGGNLGGAAIARAGLKKAAKRVKRAATKAKKTAKKVGSKVVKGVGKAAEATRKTISKVTSSGSEQKPLPKYVRGMFDHIRSTAGFDWTNAYLLSLGTKLARFTRVTAAPVIAELGLGNITWLNRGNIEGFVASNDKMVVATFRGTQFSNIRDILTDLKTALVAAHGGKVHEGTHRGIAALWSEVLAAVKKHNPSGTKQVWVAGHSLGGSIACLATARLVDAGIAVRGLYTFGQFRVGNKAFAERFKTPLFRVLNESDPVPYVPVALKARSSKTRDYMHTGKMYFIDKKGRYQPNRKWLPKLSVSRLLALATGGVTAHRSATYAQRVYGQLPSALQKAWPKPFPKD